MNFPKKRIIECMKCHKNNLKNPNLEFRMIDSNWFCNNCLYLPETYISLNYKLPEKHVYNYFSSKNIWIIRSIDIKKFKFDWKENIKVNFNDTKGMPDFYLPKENIWIEVKSMHDSLNFNQLNWIKNNPQEKVFIYFVDSTNNFISFKITIN